MKPPDSTDGNTAQPQRPVVVGVGNLLMGDEGIGVRLAQLLQGYESLPADVYELGTGVSGLMSILPNRGLALILDCVYMGEPPGSLVWFTAEQVRDRKEQLRWSLHHGSILESLELIQRLGCAPRRLLIGGIQPLSVKPGLGLSPLLEGKLEEYARLVVKRLVREEEGR
ncbi:MAG TPA: hydrogenase maturation protease [Kiritimatiellae bacterium]|nr:hydrogenase maturation protease [Kiritimatiellia bacterium]